MWIRYNMHFLAQSLTDSGIAEETTPQKMLHFVFKDEVARLLAAETDELNQIILLDVMKELCETDHRYLNDSSELQEVRQKLYRLKSKHRRRLSNQRKQLLKKYS